jgi:GTPase
LAEFQELARSAGATIAAVLIQRRGRPDPATLVGGGKLDEIVEQSPQPEPALCSSTTI